MKSGIGQDSHRFSSSGHATIAGLEFQDAPALDADSDGDVVFHAICNAITSITHVSILGDVAIELCKNGERNSRVYLEHALKTLGSIQISHVAVSIEGARPRFQKRVCEMRANIAEAMGLDMLQVGLTVTSGDGLTSFGRGEGLHCFCIISVDV